MIENTWQKQTTPVQLVENEVHVWQAQLNSPSKSISRFQHILSPEECAKAQRFYFEKDQYRWTVAHGILRILLGWYTQKNPREITFQFNAYGKPSLPTASHEPYLQFNLSHSKDLALYAFTYTRQIGVDIEYMRSDISYAELAQQSFSPIEQAVLNTVPYPEKPLAFFKGWTSKEAYIKGRGLGFSLPLHLFDVSLIPNEPAALLASRENIDEIQRWTIQKLEPDKDYVGAVAIEGPEPTVRCWQWMDN